MSRATDTVQIVVKEDAEAAAKEVARMLAPAAGASGHVVLTGGNTVGDAYEKAAVLQPDWSRVELWWGDERCVPPDDENSNFGLTKKILLDNLEQQPAEVHRIEGELDPEESARRYDEAVRGVTFDLILNGLGPDGHTASLFPNAPSLQERERLALAVPSGLEPYIERVTLTIPALENCRRMVFLVAGEDKADAVERAFGQPPSPDTPASLVRSAHGDTIAVLDEAAASLLGQ
jgi:6-phosphogluconolactonase